jgi:hypothetical protein
VYIADTINHRIRKVTISTGVITTIAGTGTPSYSGDNGPATSSTLNYPYGITLDASGTTNTDISFTESMRINSSGNVLVGKTTTSETTVGFNINTLGSAISSGTDNYWVAYNTSASAYRFYVSPAGTINATNPSITAISVLSFKENIRDLETGLTQVMALKPRRFDWKEETKMMCLNHPNPSF